MKDITQLSNEELMALSKPDITSLSNEELLGLQSQPEKGFVGNVAEDMSNRLKKQSEIYNAKQNGLSGSLQTFGNVFGAANDITKQAAGSLAKTAYENLTTQGFKDRQSLGMRELADSAAGRTLSNLTNQYQSNLDTYNRDNPEAGRNFEAVREIGGFFMPGGTKDVVKGGIGLTKVALNTTGQVAGKTAEGVMSVARDITGIEKRPQIPTPQQMGKVSKDLYAEADKLGAKLTPDFMASFVNDIKTVNPQSDIAMDLMGESASTKLNEIFGRYANKELNMKTIDEIDKVLTRKAHDSWKDHAPTADTRDILDIQTKFRSAIEKSEPQAGIEAWGDAKVAYATKKRLEDIQDIFENAKNRPNEATAIQAGFRRIAEDPARMMGYSKEAQKYIKQAARESTSVDTLKILGSRLNPIVIGGAGGGMAATAAAMTGGAIARKGAAGIKAYQGNKAGYQVMRDFEKKASPKTKAALMAEILKEKK